MDEHEQPNVWDELLLRILLLLPQLLGDGMLAILGRIVRLPLLRLKLLVTNETQQVGGDIWRYCPVEVHNNGTVKARNCFPQIVEIPYLGFEPQALSWGYNFDESSPDSTTISIAPNDRKHFVLAWTSMKQSNNDIHVINIPVARRQDRGLFHADLPIGKHSVLVTIIGDNIVVKPEKYEISLTENGLATWQTLDGRSMPLRIVLSEKAKLWIKKITQNIRNIRVKKQ